MLNRILSLSTPLPGAEDATWRCHLRFAARGNPITRLAMQMARRGHLWDEMRDSKACPLGAAVVEGSSSVELTKSATAMATRNMLKSAR